MSTSGEGGMILQRNQSTCVNDPITGTVLSYEHASKDNMLEGNPLDFFRTLTGRDYTPLPVPANEVVTLTAPEGSAFVFQECTNCFQSGNSPFSEKLSWILLTDYL
jgi:hypothetical protein